MIPDSGVSHPREAAQALSAAARRMKPVMEEFDLSIASLGELDPMYEGRLHGYNETYSGQLRDGTGNIRLALRRQPWYLMLDVMMHELLHNRHGPHDRHFYRFWNSLRDCYSKYHGDEWRGAANSQAGMLANVTGVAGAVFSEIRCSVGDIGIGNGSHRTRGTPREQGRGVQQGERPLPLPWHALLMFRAKIVRSLVFGSQSIQLFTAVDGSVFSLDRSKVPRGCCRQSR